MSGSLFCFVVLLYSLALERGASAAGELVLGVARWLACFAVLVVLYKHCLNFWIKGHFVSCKSAHSLTHSLTH